MTFDNVKEMFETLPTEKKTEVADFIQFLYQESLNSEKPKQKKEFPFDVFAGGLNYIADDFDETPEDFEEYI